MNIFFKSKYLSVVLLLSNLISLHASDESSKSLDFKGYKKQSSQNMTEDISFLNKEINHFEQNLSKEALNLSSEQIQAITRNVKYLFTYKMNREKQTSIIKICFALTPEEITDRIYAIEQYVFPLFTDNIEEYDRAYIIEAFIQLSPEKVWSTAANAKRLIRDNVNDDDRVPIIIACLELNEEQIQVIEKNTKYLFADNMTGEEQAWIIGALIELNLEQIYAITKKAHLFMNHGVPEKVAIVKACSRLSVKQIEEAKDLSSDLI